MQKKTYKIATWATLIIFFISLFNNLNLLKTSGAVVSGATIAADDNVVITGNLMSSNNLGKDWDAANYQGKLTEYSNGIYEATFKLKASATPYEYKFALNGTWDVSYGKDFAKGGSNISLNVTKDQDVTFRFDYKNQKIYDSINNPDQFKTKAILTGGLDKIFANGKAWDPSDNNFALDYVGGGIYAKTFPVTTAGVLDYKVAYNGAWNNGEVGSNVQATIPAGTTSITVYADAVSGTIYDSINNPSLTKTASLIGTVRNDTATNWDQTNTNYEMHAIDATHVLYSSVIKAGSYEYKAVFNHSWDAGAMPSENAKLTVAADTNVIFIADLKNNKIIDSVNNPVDVAVALGLRAATVEVKSPVINGNGTVTFNYKEPDANAVYLSGSFNSWSTNASPMVKNSDGIWSTTIRVGDNAQEIEYKFVADGTYVADPSNTETKNGNSLVTLPAYSGRTVTIPGSIATAISGTTGTWNAADPALKLDYMGNGNYQKTFKNVKAGTYEYKVAINNTWDPENYGDKGVNHGSNITITVPRDMDITFYYNDDSHRIVNTLNYKVENISLFNGDTKVGDLTDARLNGIYTLKTNLTAGTYDNLSLSVAGDTTKTVKVDKFTLSQDKAVTFSYDPITEICFNDASDSKLDVNGVYYDSRDTDYKSPYGATPADSPIAFNLKVKKDMATQVKMIIGTTTGTKVIDMDKNGSFDDGSDKWSTTYTTDTIGTYTYYFVISNGSDVKAYGDDDGYFGSGVVGNLGEVKNYEFNVYQKDFKTPDWLKNAVIYQIFPDRFFNGDTSNDYLKKYARGTTPFEFESNWYSLPKDPQLALKAGYNYPANANVGDTSSWSNDLYGGDLKGIEDKVGYLKALGVTVLYMNPVGESISSHRYDTTDYSKVDSGLGTMDDFVNLAKTAKANGMHVILDGVYNHVSDDSVYFDRYGKYVAAGKPLGAFQYWSKVYDQMNKNGLNQADAETATVKYYNSLGITDFHYKDWFVISNKIDTATGIYAYEGWAGYDSMPVIQALNGSEYNVKSWADEVIDGPDSISREWLKNGSDGWRLDVANEVSDQTWRAFRQAVKSEGDDAIIGEIWTDASKYILGDMYDSVMNYRFRGAIDGFVKGSPVDDNTNTAYTAKDATNELEKMREQYPREALEAMMNLVDSHDTQRVISALDGYGKGGDNRDFAEDPSALALQKMKLIPFLQMTYNGAPTIYYGDEEGLPGCDDPDNRRTFAWGTGNEDLVKWYANLAAIRSSYSALRTGDIAVSDVQSDYANDVMAYVRSDDSDKLLVAANREQNEITTTLTTPGIADGTVLTNLLNKDETYTVKDGKVTVKISALNGVILADNVKTISVNYADLADAYDPSYKIADRTIPVPDATITQSITAANNGDQIKLSTENEGISKTVLQALVDSKKNLSAVITRGNIKATIGDPAKLLAKLTAQGLTDFEFIVDEANISDQNAISDINDKVVKQLKVTTNLANGELGTDITFTIPVDPSYNGKTLYLYSVGADGRRLLKSQATVTEGKLTVSTDTLSDLIITNAEVSEDSPTVNNNNNNNNGGSTTTVTTYNPTGNTESLDSKKTADTSNREQIIFLSLLFIISCSGVFVITNYREKRIK